MKMYAPEMEVVRFEAEDVIATSSIVAPISMGNAGSNRDVIFLTSVDINGNIAGYKYMGDTGERKDYTIEYSASKFGDLHPAQVGVAYIWDNGTTSWKLYIPTS